MHHRATSPRAGSGRPTPTPTLGAALRGEPAAPLEGEAARQLAEDLRALLVAGLIDIARDRSGELRCRLAGDEDAGD